MTDPLREAWSEVGEVHQDNQSQAALFGVDVRLHPKRLFRVLFSTVKALLAVHHGGAAGTASQPIQSVGIAQEIAGACEAFLGVFYERLSELSYLVALFLGGGAGPTTVAEIEKKLPDYMNDVEGAYAADALPFYLRLTAKRIQDAREQLQLGLLARDLGTMAENGLVTIHDNRVEWIESAWTFKGGW